MAGPRRGDRWKCHVSVDVACLSLQLNHLFHLSKIQTSNLTHFLYLYSKEIKCVNLNWGLMNAILLETKIFKGKSDKKLIGENDWYI